ncbi:MAG: hypothetical protein AAB914_03500 [Patescibacteria group bacterium]
MKEDTKPKTDKKEENQKQEMPKDLVVKLYSPYKVYFKDSADSVSAVNKTGPFDILPGHHNFLTLLEKCEVIIRQPNKAQKFKIARGIMHVKKNSVTIFLDV